MNHPKSRPEGPNRFPEAERPLRLFPEPGPTEKVTNRKESLLGRTRDKFRAKSRSNFSVEPTQPAVLGYLVQW